MTISLTEQGSIGKVQVFTFLSVSPSICTNVTLGPRCFVTTNYDDLIEESLRKWQPDRFFRPPVTNRHLTETAEIVHARAINFIFKPHGDAADSESIILTREQYRQLLPQGERQAALESLKMLMASRPVVYLGFSLRDPDFVYVRDLLANTFKGGTRDHYAIMADVSDAEIDYWRRNYGIHLIGYTTTERSDKTRDHTALLTLIDNLLEKAPALSVEIDFDPCAPEVVLALARHAASLARSPINNPEFKIRVHVEKEKHRGDSNYYRFSEFDDYPVEKFLDGGPERALLIGLPGAGKTYSFRRAAARLAEKLHLTCLSEPFDRQAVVVPIFADLKLYRGNLRELVNQMMPKMLPFDELIRCFKVKIFLDSFNEMPREFLESSTYESDFEKFVTSICDASLFISSRTSDGLEKLSLPAYCLDQIDETVVTAELQRSGIEIGGRFDYEVRSLLQRPFYFQYVTGGKIRLPKEAHPRDFYQVFFENLRNAFTARFSVQLDIENALSLAAYDALNLGEEAFPLSELLRVLKMSAEIVGLADINVRDIANWLVSSSILIPYIGSRVAFVHQSVTEYLAATELARRYLTDPHILKEKLKLTRWDQALFLTLSLLPPAQAEVFLQDIINADFALALNAAKFLEVGRDEVISKLLSEVPENSRGFESYYSRIEWAIEFSLPLSDVHEPQLRKLIDLGDTLGAAAVSRLVAMKGADVKDELLQLLVDHMDDYNLCSNGIAVALRPFATDEDAKKIATWADSIQSIVVLDSDKDTDGFTTGAAQFLAGLDLSVIRQEFLPQDEKEKTPEIRARIICRLLEHHKTTAALEFAGELLLRDVKEAAFTIYLISAYPEPDCKPSWASFTAAHVSQLVSFLDVPDVPDECWELKALERLCAARLDLAELVKQEAMKKSGIAKASLLYCVSPADLTLVFEATAELIEMSEEKRRTEPIRLLRQIEFDWKGREQLFVQLLRLRDIQLASVLFGGSLSPIITNLGTLEIGPIEWWLEWMMEAVNTCSDVWFWFPNQLGALFAKYLELEVQDAFVTEFNKADSRFRQLLLHFVLPNRDDITTEVFNEDAISFMLADLNQKGSISSFRGNLLGIAATEQFVNERLLPLLPNAKQPLLKNLREVLRQAGSRHGRRYLLE
jgi:hypothetical protein